MNVALVLLLGLRCWRVTGNTEVDFRDADFTVLIRPKLNSGIAVLRAEPTLRRRPYPGLYVEVA